MRLSLRPNKSKLHFFIDNSKPRARRYKEYIKVKTSLEIHFTSYLLLDASLLYFNCKCYISLFVFDFNSHFVPFLLAICWESYRGSLIWICIIFHLAAPF